MSRAIRSLVAVLALTAFTAGAVHALPPAPRPEPAGLFDALREWACARLLPGLESLWEKAGGEMDPDGAPHTQTLDPGATTEEGGEMDPNG
jgi:hypothetical protein